MAHLTEPKITFGNFDSPVHGVGKDGTDVLARVKSLGALVRIAPTMPANSIYLIDSDFEFPGGKGAPWLEQIGIQNNLVAAFSAMPGVEPEVLWTILPAR